MEIWCTSVGFPGDFAWKWSAPAKFQACGEKSLEPARKELRRELSQQKAMDYTMHVKYKVDVVS